MAKPDRLEDLGRIAAIIDEIFDSGSIDLIDVDERTFVEVYADAIDRESLFYRLNELLRKLEKIHAIAHGDIE
jgi:hypothetical protein